MSKTPSHYSIRLVKPPLSLLISLVQAFIFSFLGYIIISQNRFFSFSKLWQKPYIGLLWVQGIETSEKTFVLRELPLSCWLLCFYLSVLSEVFYPPLVVLKSSTLAFWYAVVTSRHHTLLTSSLLFWISHPNTNVNIHYSQLSFLYYRFYVCKFSQLQIKIRTALHV